MSQTRAALGAATCEHELAGAGLHACKETVLFGAVTLLWLVSSFWHGS